MRRLTLPGGQGGQVVDHATEVLGALRRVLQETRGAAAGALEAGIGHDDDETGFGQRRGYFRGITFALTGTGIFLLLQSLPFGIWWFWALQIAVGCFIVGVNPSLSAAVTLYTEPAFRGRVFGMSTTAQQFGCMIGPLFASAVTTVVGIQYVFLVTGALLIWAGLRVWRRHKHEGPIPTSAPAAK